MDLWATLSWTSAAILLVAGIALALWALFRDRPRGRKRCPRCWYDLSSLLKPDSFPTCPECGRTPTNSRHLTRTRRRWRWAALSALPLAGGVWFAIWPTVYAHGWVGLIPTPVLLHLAFNDRLPQNSEMYAELNYRRFPQMRFWPGEYRWVMNRTLRMAREGPTTQHRERAVMMIFWIGGRDERITPALLHVAQHDQAAHVRARAIGYLGTYLADAQRVLPVLMRLAAEDPVPDVRATALHVLSNYGPLARRALPIVIASLDDEHPDVQRAAVHAAAVLEEDLEMLVPRIASLLAATTDLRERGELARSASLLGPVALPVLPVLLELLDEYPDAYIDNALRAIGSIGPAAQEALPPLNALLQDPALDPRLEYLAKIAIEVLDGTHPGMLEAHAAALDDSVYMTRDAAARELFLSTAAHRRPPQSVVDRLVHAALNDYGSPAVFAAHALSRLPDADRDPLLSILHEYSERDPEMGPYFLNMIARRETRLPADDRDNATPP